MPADNRSINAVRTIAAVLVVAEHVRAMVMVDWADTPHGPAAAAFYLLTGLGSSAVMIFFVLSGFWVGGSVLRSARAERFRWRSYLLRRGVRLWVVLVPASVIAIAVGWVLVTGFSSTDVGAGSPAYHNVVSTHLADTLGVGTWIGNITFVQGILVSPIGTDGPLWSLAYEFWYYILFPLIVLAVLPGRLARRVTCALLAVVVAVFIGGPILGLFPVWLMGCGIAVAQPMIARWLARSRIRARIAIAIALVAVAGTLVVREARMPTGLLGEYMVALAATLLIASLVNDVDLRATVWAPIRGAARYAQSSYSLYVIHLPLLLLVIALLVPDSSGRGTFTPLSVGFVLLLTAALMVAGWGFAVLTEHRTERLRSAIDRVLPGGARRSLPDASIPDGSRTSGTEVG